MNKLIVRDVSVAVDDRLVVDKASFEAEAGLVTVIMGPNGAGKSSLLAAIAGLPRYRIVSGRILVDGEDVTSLPCWVRARKGIVLAYQMPPTARYVKVESLVKWMCRHYGWSLLEAVELAKMMKVDGLLDRRLFQGFSGGERKRMELYLALLQKPKVALLDEPDSGVDIDSLRIVEKAILMMVENGAIVVLVSHTPHLLHMLRERGVLGEAYILVRGRIVFSGPASKVVKIVEERGYNPWM